MGLLRSYKKRTGIKRQGR